MSQINEIFNKACDIVEQNLESCIFSSHGGGHSLIDYELELNDKVSFITWKDLKQGIVVEHEGKKYLYPVTVHSYIRLECDNEEDPEVYEMHEDDEEESYLPA